MKKAYSMVEIVITLGIIGLISAVTLPAFNQGAKDKQYRTKVFKAYGSIAQATDMLLQDYRSTKYFPDDLNSAYAKYLNVVKTCPPATGCNTTDKIKLATGGDDYLYGDKGLVLADGVSLIIGRGVGAVVNYGLSDDDKANAFATIHIDANGPLPPNKWGVDHWLALIVNGKGIVPSGADHTTATSGGCVKTYGCLSDIVKDK